VPAAKVLKEMDRAWWVWGYTISFNERVRARAYSYSRRYYYASMIETAMKWVSRSRLPDSDFIVDILAYWVCVRTRKQSTEDDTLAGESIQERLFKEA